MKHYDLPEGYETPDPDALGTLRRLAPLPPEVLADALQDRIHPTSGRLLGASPVPTREALHPDDARDVIAKLGARCDAQKAEVEHLRILCSEHAAARNDLTREVERLKLEIVRGNHVHGSCSMLAGRCGALEAQRAALKAEIERLRRCRADDIAFAVKADRERDAARADVRGLREALGEFNGNHKPGCACLVCNALANFGVKT